MLFLFSSLPRFWDTIFGLLKYKISVPCCPLLHEECFLVATGCCRSLSLGFYGGASLCSDISPCFINEPREPFQFDMKRGRFALCFCLVAGLDQELCLGKVAHCWLPYCSAGGQAEGRGVSARVNIHGCSMSACPATLLALEQQALRLCRLFPALFWVLSLYVWLGQLCDCVVPL